MTQAGVRRVRLKSESQFRCHWTNRGFCRNICSVVVFVGCVSDSFLWIIFKHLQHHTPAETISPSLNCESAMCTWLSSCSFGHELRLMNILRSATYPERSAGTHSYTHLLSPNTQKTSLKLWQPDCDSHYTSLFLDVVNFCHLFVRWIPSVGVDEVVISWSWS